MGRGIKKNLRVNSIIAMSIIILLSLAVITGCSNGMLDDIQDKIIQDEAEFINSFSLDTAVDDSGSGSIDSTNSTANGIYDDGTSVTARATADSGSIFMGWYNAASGGTVVSTANPYTFTLNVDTVLYARFVSLAMNTCPGGTFPTGESDGGDATVSDAFLIAETEVTYELWSAVYAWAAANDYSFANAGMQGSGGAGTTNQHPVTTINWRDAMIWMNALTEYYNEQNGTSLVPVYYTDGANTILQKTATNATERTFGTAGSQDAPYVKTDADGFRLPTHPEWECAARYIGTTDPGYGILNTDIYWTPGDFASGATADYDYDDSTATKAVAWYNANSGSTKIVGQKNGNALGLYDMSGNVYEWCFTADPVNPSDYRIYPGGSWQSSNITMRVGYNNAFYPDSRDDGRGFRVVRNP